MSPDSAGRQVAVDVKELPDLVAALMRRRSATVRVPARFAYQAAVFHRAFVIHK
ncbi:hypothetical protein [Streptomyces sp. NPDC000880]